MPSFVILLIHAFLVTEYMRQTFLYQLFDLKRSGKEIIAKFDDEGQSKH